MHFNKDHVRNVARIRHSQAMDVVTPFNGTKLKYFLTHLPHPRGWKKSSNFCEICHYQVNSRLLVWSVVLISHSFLFLTRQCSPSRRLPSHTNGMLPSGLQTMTYWYPQTVQSFVILCWGSLIKPFLISQVSPPSPSSFSYSPLKNIINSCIIKPMRRTFMNFMLITSSTCFE